MHDTNAEPRRDDGEPFVESEALVGERPEESRREAEREPLPIEDPAFFLKEPGTTK